MNASELIIGALTEGGVAGVAVLGWVAWLLERRRSMKREDQVLELATAQVQATVETDAAIESNTKVLERLERNLEKLR